MLRLLATTQAPPRYQRGALPNELGHNKKSFVHPRGFEPRTFSLKVRCYEPTKLRAVFSATERSISFVKLFRVGPIGVEPMTSRL